MGGVKLVANSVFFCNTSFNMSASLLRLRKFSSKLFKMATGVVVSVCNSLWGCVSFARDTHRDLPLSAFITMTTEHNVKGNGHLTIREGPVTMTAEKIIPLTRNGDDYFLCRPQSVADPLTRHRNVLDMHARIYNLWYKNEYQGHFEVPKSYSMVYERRETTVGRGKYLVFRFTRKDGRNKG